MEETTDEPPRRGPGRPRKQSQVPPLNELIGNALENPIQPPPPKPKNPKRANGIWATLRTPEERTAYAKTIRSRVKPENLKRTGRKAGVPNGWKSREYDEAMKLASAQVDLAMRALDVEERLPDNALAQEAIKALLHIVFSPGPYGLRLRAARTVLTFTKALPKRQDDHFAEAEAWLYQLAEESDAE